MAQALGSSPHLHDGRLLEGVAADELARHLAGDGHQRHRVEQRVGQAGDQVGGARARGGNAHAHAASHLGVPLGRKDLALRAGRPGQTTAGG